MAEQELSDRTILIKEILENQRDMTRKLDAVVKESATKGDLAALRAELADQRAELKLFKENRLPNWFSTALISGATSTTAVILGYLATTLLKAHAGQ